MTRTTKILFIVLAIAYGLSGIAGLTGASAIRDSLTKLGVSNTLGILIGVAEVAASVGLIIGLRKPVIGVAAATGIIALMIGAVTYHVRAHDWAGPGRADHPRPASRRRRGFRVRPQLMV